MSLLGAGRAKAFMVAFAVLAGLMLLVFALRPAQEIPFTSEAWLSSPADGRWVQDNVRFRMRNGAVQAARTCSNGEEVLSILGPPDGNSDFARSRDPKGPTYGYLYRLGHRRQPLLFWESLGESYLEVQLGSDHQVVGAEVVERGF